MYPNMDVLISNIPRYGISINHITFRRLTFCHWDFFGGSETHFSGCFWLFAPKFWGVGGTYECHFVVFLLHIEWWGHSNPACCNRKNLNFLHSQVVEHKNISLTPVPEPPGKNFTIFCLIGYLSFVILFWSPIEGHSKIFRFWVSYACRI